MSLGISKNDTTSCFSVLSCFCCLRGSEKASRVDSKVTVAAGSILRENMMENPLRAKLLDGSKVNSSSVSDGFVRRNCEPYGEVST